MSGPELGGKPRVEEIETMGETAWRWREAPPGNDGDRAAG